MISTFILSLLNAIPRHHWFSLLVLFLFIPLSVFAQSGRIAGTVVDKETGEPLFSASVLVVETSTGATTDFDGKYLIKNLAPGSYTLRVSYISYATQTITGVTVLANEVTTIDVLLETESATLEEVIVSAEAVRNNEASLLRQRQKAIAFSDAISAETISSSGAGDAAAAMTKVVGASVVGGKYVYIRGLGDRYSSTHLNGVELPTSDPDRKSFQLDLFPSALLDNIVTVKTFTPDKPGTFSGGLVDVSTKDIPSNAFVSVSSSASYNTATTGSDLLLGSSSDSDWLGMDTGSRALPDAVKGLTLDQYPKEINARRDPEAARQIDQIARSFSPEMLPSVITAGINQSYSIAHGNRFDFGENSAFGYTASLSYSNTYKNYANGAGGRYELIGTDYQSTQSLDTKKEFQSDLRGSHSVDWGGLLSLTASLKGANKITFTAIRTQSGENQGRYLTGYWQDAPSAVYRTQVNAYTDRGLISYQLKGRHEFTKLNGAMIEWNASTNSNSQSQPDLRFFESQYTVRDRNGVADTVYQNPSSLYPRPIRFFRDLEEENQAFSADVTLPFDLFGNNQKFKAGVNYQTTDRIFRELRFDIYDGALSQRYTLFDGNDEAYFSNLGVVNGDYDKPVVGTYMIRASSDRSNYDADQRVNAYYAMFDLRPFDWMNLIGGVRMEDASMFVISQDPDSPSGKLDNQDLLPSVNMILNVTDEINLRFAYTNTIARPTFRELAPYTSFDFAGDNLFRGSSLVQRTLIKNLDGRIELYPASGEVLAFSVFYKWLENPIERVIDPTFGGGSSTLNETVQNVPTGRTYGFEVELRKNLGFISQALNGFNLSTNFTLVNSEVDISELEMLIIRTIQADAADTRPLFGQSPYIVNVDLSYNNPAHAFYTALSFNYFDDRLSKVTIGAAPDIYEKGYSMLNLVIGKDFGKNVSVKLTGKNLLDPFISEQATFKGVDYINYRYKEGKTFGLNVKYQF